MQVSNQTLASTERALNPPSSAAAAPRYASSADRLAEGPGFEPGDDQRSSCDPESHLLVRSSTPPLGSSVAGRTSYAVGVPRTIEELEAEAAKAEEWLDSLDPDKVPGKDATPLRHLRECFEDYVAAGRRVADAASVARASGFSWGSIGMVLGISKQAAQARFEKIMAEADKS